jgi:DNA-binding NtrC family response regulator
MKQASRKPRVLVVDDEPSVLATYRMILQQKGYDPVAAISSGEARAAIDHERLDLLLCDLSLEEKNTGFEVIAYARRIQPALPSVLLTGYATKDIAEKAAQNGIVVLFKPIDIDEFLSTIAAQLRSGHEQHQEQEAKNRGGKSASIN